MDLAQKTAFQQSYQLCSLIDKSKLSVSINFKRVLVVALFLRERIESLEAAIESVLVILQIKDTRVFP
jgi:transcriptional regulatory protein LevR